MGLFKPNIKKMRAQNDIEGLIKSLKHSSVRVRYDAVTALGELKNARAIEPLIEALRDDTGAGWQAVNALSNIGYAAVEPLIRALQDKDKGIVRLAARALGELKDDRATEPLVEVLRDEDWNYRYEAVMALGKIGDTKAIDPLIVALKDVTSAVGKRQRLLEKSGTIGQYNL